MSEEDFVPSRRQEIREVVRRDAECRIGDLLWVGTVHDLSSAGAFFEPKTCLTNGERLDAEDAWMAGAPRQKAVLVLTEGDSASDHQDGVARAGIVQWSGCSDTHRCGGLGLEFPEAA